MTQTRYTLTVIRPRSMTYVTRIKLGREQPMSMTAAFDENTGGVHGTKKHRWGKPMPGAGPMQVCTVCGEKQTTITAHEECGGRPADGLAVTAYDYEPT